MHQIGKVIEDNEDWIMYEIMMQHNAIMIHAQIDLLLKQKQRRKIAFRKHLASNVKYST
jgi:hypothetical protein